MCGNKTEHAPLLVKKVENLGRWSLTNHIFWTHINSSFQYLPAGKCDIFFCNSSWGNVCLPAHLLSGCVHAKRKKEEEENKLVFIQKNGWTGIASKTNFSLPIKC